MSLETLVEGNRAKSTDGTLVLLTGTLCKTRNKPQDSLQVTPQRLPIEGKPSECKQEVAEGVAMAGCMDRMVEMANMDVDIDRMALLGGDLVERACRVDEGDGTEHGYQAQLQQTILYCKEDQSRGNANANVPSAYGVLLEGEWAVCVSGKSGCGGGMSGFMSIDEADGNIGQRIEPAGTPNKLKGLVIMLIESEPPDSGRIPCVCLGGMWMVLGAEHAM